MNLHFLKMFMLISVLILFNDVQVVAAPTGSPGFCAHCDEDNRDGNVENLPGHLATVHDITVQRSNRFFIIVA